jgi:hypothetical protein
MKNLSLSHNGLQEGVAHRQAPSDFGRPAHDQIQSELPRELYVNGNGLFHVLTLVVVHDDKHVNVAIVPGIAPRIRSEKDNALRRERSRQ